MRKHLFGRLARFGEEDLAGRLEPSDPIPDTLLRPGSDALDLTELAPLARFLELRQGLDSQAAPQDLDALQAQLRYAAQLGGPGGKAPVKVLERPRRSRPVDLCDDRRQARADPAKLGQASVVDESGEVSTQPLESTRGPIVRAHFEGLLSREIEEPCHLMKASRDGEPVESGSHVDCVPGADWPSSPGPPSGGAGPYEEAGGWPRERVLRASKRHAGGTKAATQPSTNHSRGSE